MSAALDDAWQSLHAVGIYFTSRGLAEAAREKLALRIIEMAKLGERDKDRLRQDALLHLDPIKFGSTKSKKCGL
jgi:hypothetical protein